MGEKGVVKHFLSLQIPKECQDYISRAAEALPRHHGHMLGAPFKRTSYHITLGVLEVPANQIFLLEPLRERLQDYLNSLITHSLVFNKIGWFDDGAVFLQMDDDIGPGYIHWMREMIVTFCSRNNIKYFDSENFHISLFKTNNIPKGTCIDTDTYVLSLGKIKLGHMACIDTVDLRQVKNW